MCVSVWVSNNRLMLSVIRNTVSAPTDRHKTDPIIGRAHRTLVLGMSRVLGYRVLAVVGTFLSVYRGKQNATAAQSCSPDTIRCFLKVYATDEQMFAVFAVKAGIIRLSVNS